ncbi:MAG TPA: hypothetical protein VM198_10420 [Longimicrobiales bacterium]|nr:hypothetical protein [Longimicrobiales bacterium]
MTDVVSRDADEDPDGLPPRPAIDEDPAILDAHRTFLATLLGAAIFIALVVSFIL